MRHSENARVSCLLSLGDVLMTAAFVRSKTYLIAERRKTPRKRIPKLHVRSPERVRSCCYGVALKWAVRMQIGGTLGGVHVYGASTLHWTLSLCSMSGCTEWREFYPLGVRLNAEVRGRKIR